MKKTNIFLQALLCLTVCFSMLIMTACQKENDIVDIPHQSFCEVINDHLYEKAWIWTEDHSDYKDITIFHRSTLERILVYQRDTISQYHTPYKWMDTCKDFAKLDSHPEVTFRIKSINSETLIITRFFEKKYEKDLRFEIN